MISVTHSVIETAPVEPLVTNYYEVPDAGISVFEESTPEGKLQSRTVGVDDYFYARRNRTATGGLQSLPDVYIKGPDGKLTQVKCYDENGERLDGISDERAQQIIDEMFMIRHAVSDACAERLGRENAAKLFRFVPIDDLTTLTCCSQN